MPRRACSTHPCQSCGSPTGRSSPCRRMPSRRSARRAARVAVWAAAFWRMPSSTSMGAPAGATISTSISTGSPLRRMTILLEAPTPTPRRARRAAAAGATISSSISATCPTCPRRAAVRPPPPAAAWAGANTTWRRRRACRPSPSGHATQPSPRTTWRQARLRVRCSSCAASSASSTSSRSSPISWRSRRRATAWRRACLRHPRCSRRCCAAAAGLASAPRCPASSRRSRPRTRT